MFEERKSHSLVGIIERLQENSAIVSLPDNKKIFLPIKLLPPDWIIGSKITITISAGTNSEEKNQTAKDFLNRVFDNL